MDTKNIPYPKYITYEDAHLEPTILSQEYPRPIFSNGETYYPPNPLLDPYLSCDTQQSKFGAASFCGFLEDTIEVEHCLVIPAVAALRRLPYEIPQKAEQDLYKTATDEGYHAEQSLQYLNDLRSHFGLTRSDEFRTPLFLRRLEEQRAAEGSELFRDLITVLNGVVTETRISIELSRFASDTRLADSVRRICRTHAQDEAIHASQFRALGTWLWEMFDGTTRSACAGFLVASTIARSMPDIDRLADYLNQSTQLGHNECARIVCDTYSEHILITELMTAAKPTFKFLRELDVTEYVSIEDALHEEESRQRIELARRRSTIHAALHPPNVQALGTERLPSLGVE